MAPEWWFQAYEACEEIHGDEWESMSEDERDEAVTDYLATLAEGKDG